MDDDSRRAFHVLEHMRRARLSFETRICAASRSQDEAVLQVLRFESMFDFAEFFFTLEAMGLKGPDDIGILAELHNQRIEDLTRNPRTVRRRGLSVDRLLKAIFTSDVRPRLEQIWRERPGALDQSNLARFLVTQMSAEWTRNLSVACEAAGFVTRTRHANGATIVESTGVMERIFERCLLDFHDAIAAAGGRAEDT